MPTSANFNDDAVLDALGAMLPHQTVHQVISDLGVVEQRCRKLPAALTLLLVIAFTLFPRDSQQQVLGKLLKGLRLIWPDPSFRNASKSAICQARYSLGARPLVALFRRHCRPLATPHTPGAFLFGKRLLALDGTREDVPDTPANDHAFGRGRNQHGPAAFPQVLGMYLVECGTHAVVDAGFWSCRTSEHAAAPRLFRSVPSDSLVLWDAGLHSFHLAQLTRTRQADFLGRVPSKVRLPVHQRLPDGSGLAWLYPGTDEQRRGEHRLLVRVLEYTFTDPHRPHAGERHRLMTSLLDPDHASALDLICAYHERWEVELTIDELDTHQRLLQHPLRSQKPVGVLQELYALLIAHYVIRAVMYDAAMTAPVPEDPRRLSFINAVRLVCDALSDFQMVTPEEHPALYQRLLADVRCYRLPPRANRIEPRVVKRTAQPFAPKRPHHRRWPQPTIPFRDAIALLN